MILPLHEEEGTRVLPTMDQSITDTISSMDAVKAKEKLDHSVPQISFSHVQIYVDHLDDLGVYKSLETSLNTLDSRLGWNANEEHKDDTQVFVSAQNILQVKRSLWQSLCYDGVTHGEGVQQQPFVPQNRDIVKQLLVGFGMRVTGTCQGDGTMSVLVTSKDSCGIQIVVTAKDDSAAVLNSSVDSITGQYQHFDSGQ
jgi:hypothetical protein